MSQHTDVMISSTARDLPDHRKQAMDAVLRAGMYPHVMEMLPANDADALAVSLKMVDDAEIYVGIFANRYGYVPKGYNISVTEMEYNRATERGIPRLIFFMHDDHPIKKGDVETGEGALKLEALKQRLSVVHVVNYFKSSEDLRAQILQSLIPFRGTGVKPLHRVESLDIPHPPAPYIAHPYTLLQTTQVIGRTRELNTLTNWITGKSNLHDVRIFNIVAIGGMGKSALTWKWFNDIAPQERPDLAGRFWWSFYESDATFENFVIRALAYVSGEPREVCENFSRPDREERLLNILTQKSYLFVLDGLERILNAYARMDAARMSDDDLDQQTANRVAGAIGTPAIAADSIIGQHQLRKTSDPRAGVFLRKMATLDLTSRILITTRLYPSELQTNAGDPYMGCAAIFLRGLSDDDAINLWRAFKVTGSREELLPIFHRLDNYPLLIRAWAGEIRNSRSANGDLHKWLKANLKFDPFKYASINAKFHVLEYAMRDLSDPARHILQTLAAVRMPASYDTLAAVLIGENKSITTENTLDNILTELEDRGLVGWDRLANRYDLHPVVRVAIWATMSDEIRLTLYTALSTYFRHIAVPKWTQVEHYEDLTPAIELYYALIARGQYDDAQQQFYDHLSDAMLYRLSAARRRRELLEMLFPNGLEALPHLSRPDAQAYTLNAMALAYKASGQPERAVTFFRRANSIYERMKNNTILNVGLVNLSDTLRLSGELHEAELVARRTFRLSSEMENRFQEAASLNMFGLASAAHGDHPIADVALRRAVHILKTDNQQRGEGYSTAYFAQVKLWAGEPTTALNLAIHARELADINRDERPFIDAARLHGTAALALGDFATADEQLHRALTRARAVDLVEQELPALTGLAELARQRDDLIFARKCLDEIWDLTDRDSYPFWHADAFNVLAHIERNAGNISAAGNAAINAYTKAWCDGISSNGRHCYAYIPALTIARTHLAALNVPEPELPPFDPTTREHMSYIEIDPDDELNSP